jgi:hypothetical protein
MFKTVQRMLIILLIIGGLLWFFSPRLFDQAANSLITSADASISQAQGLAQFVPAGVNQSQAGNLQVKIDGLTPNTPYEVTLDQGHCGATGMDLGTITSDSNGSFYNEFSLTAFKADSTWYVDIQQKTDGQSVACGLLETNSTSGSQVVSASNDGPNVFGGSQPLPNDQSQTPTPAATSTPTQPSGLPNTGADPGNNQHYDNNTYPRKY